MKHIAILTVAILIISCSEKSKLEEGTGNVVDVSIYNLEDCNFMPYSELFDSVNLIPLETNERCLIGKIDKVLYHNNMILILDKIVAKSVFMFDKHGGFVRKIGKIGRGPGEYISPAEMVINPYADEILIYDNAKAVIMAYGMDGEFRHETKLENRIESFGIFNTDKLALYFNFNKNDNIDVLPKHNLHIVDRELDILHKGFDRTNSNIPALEGTNNLSLSQDDLLFHPSFDDKIYRISANSIIPVYRFDFGKQALDENAINSLTANANNAKETLEAIASGGKAYIRDFFQTDNYIILNVAHDQLIKNVFYSKRTGKVKVATIFFNDKYGLIPGTNDFSGFDGDFAISYFLPNEVPLQYYKELMNGSIGDEKYIANEMLKSLNRQSKTEDDCFHRMRKFFDNMAYRPTAKEQSNIMGLTEESNPVLLLYSIKEF